MRTTVIALGGVVGSLARYGLSRLMPTTQHGFPLSTLLVNVTGAFVLGAILTWCAWTRRNMLWQPFLTVGVLGGFTTFSAMAEQVADQHSALLGVYVVLTVLSGMAAVTLGSALSRRLISRSTTAS